MEFEQPRIYTTSVLPGEELPDGALSEAGKQLKRFILEFYIGGSYIYREQLRENVLTGRYFLKIHMTHLVLFQEDLGQRLSDEPGVILPIFESVAKEVATRIVYNAAENSAEGNSIPSIQILLESDANTISLRDLTSRHVSKLVRIPGIVISASALTSKATKLKLMCRSCRTTTEINVHAGFSSLQMPQRCIGMAVDGTNNELGQDCGPDPYVVVHDKSKFIDQQVLKLQESPEMVPVGELPRNILLTVDRSLCNTVVPGARCTVEGIYSVYEANRKNNKGGAAAVAIRNPYLQVVGFAMEGQNNRGEVVFSEEEEEQFLAMSRMPDLYNKFAQSIAPSIYGHEDIKKSIACLLVGGSRRILPDGLRLRGDINVLLMGDPGTAKSQLLKFVEKVAPICIYTSGKGSSAAGLTASVQRDPATKDFYLEGGAMVLADGGIVCIDEFDKMREDDRVAIHEAMEQQTISIAKAGITTVLNSRTSVLAAANPLEGRYNDQKSPGENIDFQTTILSRFDMIYVIKDAHNEAYDQRVARHVMNTHMNSSAQLPSEVEGEIPLETMRRYVTYCRAKCAPRLSPAASEKLCSHFVEIRKQVHDHEVFNNVRSSVPITVRQLEALVRITESLAKLELNPVANERHVDEAIRLFNASTMNALQQEHTSELVANEVRALEEQIKRRLRVGYSAEYDIIRREFTENSSRNVSRRALDTALRALEGRGTIQFRNQQRRVYRLLP